MGEGRRRERHGMHKSTEYNSWASMKSRWLCIHEWARRTGISIASLYARVKRGWSWDRATRTRKAV